MIHLNLLAWLEPNMAYLFLLTKFLKSVMMALVILALNFAVFLSGYTIWFQSENYSDGSPINHCERKKPDCFISCAKRDYGLISRLSDMVILHPQQGSVLVHLQNLEILSGGINFISERLQKLNQFAFLLSIAQPLQSHTLLQATANRKQTGTKQICPV